MKVKFLLLLLIAGNTSFSQTVQNLIFEGAGIRGLAYSGAIKELEKNNGLKDLKRVGGTSAGAITALLLSMNYNADEITSVINSTPFRKFNDGKFLFIGGINRIRKYYGWYRGKKFEKWLSELIELKTGNADITFSQMKQMGYKDLYVTGTCLNKQSLIIFSHENYPQMKVKDAVRISMSIPFYFEAVFIDKSGKVVYHPSNKDDVDVMVDGGIIGNFPIKMFDSTRYFNASQPNKFETNPFTLGFRIDREEQIKKDEDGKDLAQMRINNFNTYLAAFYNIVIENLNRQALSTSDWERTVSISDGSIQPRIRRMNEKEIKKLTGNGAKATLEYLRKHN